MTRAITGGILAVVILVTTFVMTMSATSSIDKRARKQLKKRANNAGALSEDTAALDGLRVLNWVQHHAGLQVIVDTIRAKSRTAQADLAGKAIDSIKGARHRGEPPAVLVAITDTEGNVVAHNKHKHPPKELWKDQGKLRQRYQGVALAVAAEKKQRRAISEYWKDSQFGLLRVGISPVTYWEKVEEKQQINKRESIVVTKREERLAGALIIGYAVDQAYVQTRSDLLGAQIAYFHGDTAGTSSFRKANGDEDTGKRAALDAILKGGMAKDAIAKGYTDVTAVNIDGDEYYASAGRLPRFPVAGELPKGYPPVQVGALVLVPVSDAMHAKSKVKTATWVVGIVALLMGIIAMVFVAQRILHQVDEIETGVNEINSGNLELAFRPVGSDLDGLAHSLNVMLARLLGRPEPGEEEYDEQGNIVMPGRLQFDTDLSDKDEEIVKLAREPEPDYYNRIFREYCDARAAVGESVEGVSYDNFVTKLRVNEATLKSKYQCQSIRFKVVVKDGKVSLKPVPIV